MGKAFPYAGSFAFGEQPARQAVIRTTAINNAAILLILIIFIVL